MTNPPLKVLFVTAELAPFAAVGGLSQVMYFLPKALRKQNVDASIFMPKYGTIDEKKHHIELLIKGLKVPTGETQGVTELVCNIKVRKGSKREPTIYFLENREYFEQRANVYGYSDDHVRFGLLSRGVIEFIRQANLRPNILHCNDWHTGYVPNFLRTVYAEDPQLKAISTVLTIHNLRNQGLWDFRFCSPTDFDDGKSPIAPFFSKAYQKLNSLKRGIIYADVVNAVSETYAREIMTERYGEGLHDLIKELRVKVFGVLNGLNYTDFDPSTDKVIKKNFSWRNLEARTENKLELQKEFNLPVDPEIPILSVCGRLDDQKGLDLLAEILPPLLEEHEVQFVIMGTGEPKYREFFTKLEATYPNQVGTHMMRNWILPRKIYAGTDMLLLPSKFEPGGIVVIEGMRYGAIPVVRSTGGLADIVTDYDPMRDEGNGFTFHKYKTLSLYGAIVRALQVYKNKRSWPDLVKRVLKADFSWDQVAEKYIDLYERAIEFRRDRQSPVAVVRRTDL